MPKHLIEFNLPEERSEMETVLNAGNYYSALSDLSQLLRKMTKYDGHPTEERLLNEKEAALALSVRERFYEILSENGINDGDL